MEELVAWCHNNNLSLNTDKTKEMIVDPRRKKVQHTPLYIGEAEVDRVTTFQFLGTRIREDLTWSHNILRMTKKSQQRPYFLRRLRKFGMLSNFYRGTVESVLTTSITVITGAAFPLPQDIYSTRVTRRAQHITKDRTHPLHRLC